MRFSFLLALALTMSSGLQANLILNGDFESVAIGSGASAGYGNGDVTGLPPWTVTGGSNCTTVTFNCVSVLSGTYTEFSGSLLFQAQSGQQSVDMTGLGNTIDGGLQQTVTSLISGQRYTLTFWLGNQTDTNLVYSQSSSLSVLVNGISQGTFTNANITPNQVNWQQMSLDFIAGSTTALVEFRNATPLGDNYAGLDNVDISAAATPEPSTFALLGLGGAALGFVRRRRTALPAGENFE